MFYSNNCRLSHQESEKEDFHKIKAVISSTALDSYYTRMTMKTLKNFRSAAKSGIQLKDSHLMNNGFGISTDARIKGEELIVDFELMRDQPLNPPASYPNSDHFARAIKEGIINDVSVGFSGGRVNCDICDADWYRCYHLCGVEYEIEGRGKVLATATIDDAELCEVSTVYSGANPDAVIIDRINHCISEGQVDEKTLSMLSERYGVRFNEGKKEYSIPKMESENMDASKERIEILEKSNKDLKELSERQEEKIETLQKTIDENKELVTLGREARDQKIFDVKTAYKKFKMDRDNDINRDELERFEKRLTGMGLADLEFEQKLYEDLMKDSDEDEKGKGVSPGQKTETADVRSTSSDDNLDKVLFGEK